MWTERVSRSTGGTYYFNTVTGESMWDRPAAMDRLVVIVVPFRDTFAEQRRSMHLQTLVSTLPAMLDRVAQDGARFQMVVVEQSDDKRKFNRGKLLNIGFEYARELGATHVIFHDVDLIPDETMAASYFITPAPGHVLHLARRWGRYASDPGYIGGVTSIRTDDFAALNGFPNHFWGWGGEDDELMARVRALGLVVDAPAAGTFQDLEEMSLADKLSALRKNVHWKCLVKHELLAESDMQRQKSGLSSLSFREVSRRVLREYYAGMITVDLMTNGHWADDIAGIEHCTWGRA